MPRQFAPGTFTLVPRYIHRQPWGRRLRPIGIAIVQVLQDHADADGWAWPSQRTIAGRIGAGVSAVGQKLGQLVAWGILEERPRPGKTTAYRVSSLAPPHDVQESTPAPHAGVSVATPAPDAEVRADPCTRCRTTPAPDADELNPSELNQPAQPGGRVSDNREEKTEDSLEREKEHHHPPPQVAALADTFAFDRDSPLQPVQQRAEADKLAAAFGQAIGYPATDKCCAAAAGVVEQYGLTMALAMLPRVVELCRAAKTHDGLGIRRIAGAVSFRFFAQAAAEHGSAASADPTTQARLARTTQQAEAARAETERLRAEHRTAREAFAALSEGAMALFLGLARRHQLKYHTLMEARAMSIARQAQREVERQADAHPGEASGYAMIVVPSPQGGECRRIVRWVRREAMFP
jgi:hypothetical protein